MTMRIKITNEDSSRDARVLVREHAGNVPTGNFSVSEVRTIRPGGAAEFWIHRGRTLVVEEHEP